MTGYELEDLKAKELKGTITKRELKRLNACLDAGGKTGIKYDKKKRQGTA